MKKFKILLLFVILGVGALSVNKLISDNQKQNKRERRAQINWKIDNQGYWRKLISEGLVLGNPDVKVAAATYTGSEIRSPMSVTEDSPDVPVASISSSTQTNLDSISKHHTAHFYLLQHDLSFISFCHPEEQA